MIAAVKIVPSEDGDSTVVSAGEQVWRKKYPSMPDATTEAVELRIMEPHDKTFVDASQRQPTWPGRGYAPTRRFEVDVEELIRRDFLLDA